MKVTADDPIEMGTTKVTMFGDDSPLWSRPNSESSCVGYLAVNSYPDRACSTREIVWQSENNLGE